MRINPSIHHSPMDHHNKAITMVLLSRDTIRVHRCNTAHHSNSIRRPRRRKVAVMVASKLVWPPSAVAFSANRDANAVVTAVNALRTASKIIRQPPIPSERPNLHYA